MDFFSYPVYIGGKSIQALEDFSRVRDFHDSFLLHELLAYSIKISHLEIFGGRP